MQRVLFDSGSLSGMAPLGVRWSAAATCAVEINPQASGAAMTEACDQAAVVADTRPPGARFAVQLIPTSAAVAMHTTAGTRISRSKRQ